MSKKDFLKMSSEERLKALSEMPDEEIDYSDIPELDEEFLETAKIIRNPFNLNDENELPSEPLIQQNIVNWFKSKAGEKSYKALMNQVLKTYMENHP